MLCYDYVGVRQVAQRPLVATRQRARKALAIWTDHRLKRPHQLRQAAVAGGVLRLQSMSLYGGEDGDRVAFFKTL